MYHRFSITVDFTPTFPNMSHTPASSAAILASSQTSRSALQAALKSSDYKDLSLWAALIRFDVLQAAASSSTTTSTWLSISSLADSAIVSNKDAWKASPSLYLSVTLDQTRALLRCGSVGEAKRTLGTLRSVSIAKHSWEFFKLLTIIECRQGVYSFIPFIYLCSMYAD